MTAGALLDFMSRSFTCRRYDGQEVDRGAPRARDHRVGGRVTPPVRPHHRAYGSVHGGSSAPLQIPELSQKVQESPHRKQAIVHGRMHVRGPRVPPGASPGGGGLARTRSLEEGDRNLVGN